ncbi:MAG: molybdenum cofactor guanylyltransferase [Deltaproteobacteria bacterium]|nr:molybdenum cofactor guanylyltransferase [Deltaproteobacteria bacterium]
MPVMPARQQGVKPGLPHLTGAILAGGFSRRLGQDKAARQLGGKPLALWVNEALAPLVASCWLITNQPLVHLAFGLPLMTDLRPFQGPAGGLLTALFFARTPWVLAAAVDNPFLAPALLAELATRASRTSRPAVVCRSPRGLEPFPGVYAVRLLPALQAFLRADRRPTRFLEACQPQILSETEVLALDPEGRSFFNLNTPRDLNRAEAWLSGTGSLRDCTGLEGKTEADPGD